MSNGSLINVQEERANNVIGKKIASARKQQKLSMREFRELLLSCGVDISTPAISKWENGQTIPNAYQLVAIAMVLGIDDFISTFSSKAELNEIGISKVHEYRKDLIATNRYSL